MAKLSKRAQVEALGWTFKAVPHFWPAGALWHDPATGQHSPASWDHERPDGWVATPPPGFPASPRRFDTSSPNPAVRWAYDQAMAPRLQADLGGVAGATHEISQPVQCRRSMACQSLAASLPRPEQTLQGPSLNGFVVPSLPASNT